MTKTPKPIEPVEPGESGNAEVDAFLRQVQQGWILNPQLMALYAQVPQGVLGWRRMVEGLVDTIGPIAWEIVAHRAAVITGTAYETTHPDLDVRGEIETLLPAIRSIELEAEALSRRHYLVASLAEGVARHEVEAELFQKASNEFETRELVGLCMAAALAHVAQLVSNTLGVSPAFRADTLQEPDCHKARVEAPQQEGS